MELLLNTDIKIIWTNSNSYKNGAHYFGSRSPAGPINVEEPFSNNGLEVLIDLPNDKKIYENIIDMFEKLKENDKSLYVPHKAPGIITRMIINPDYEEKDSRIHDDCNEPSDNLYTNAQIGVRYNVKIKFICYKNTDIFTFLQTNNLLNRHNYDQNASMY